MHWTEAMHENLLYNFLFVWLFNCLLTCWIWYDCYSSVLFLCFVSTYILIISFSFLFHLNCIKCAWLWVFPDSENTIQKKSVFWYILHSVMYLFIYLYICTHAVYIYIIYIYMYIYLYVYVYILYILYICMYRIIYVIMKAMCSLGCYHSGFVATRHLGHNTYGFFILFKSFVCLWYYYFLCLFLF